MSGRISKLSSYTRSYRSPAVEFRRNSGNSTLSQPETAISKAMNALKAPKFRKTGKHNSSGSHSSSKRTTERENNDFRKKLHSEKEKSKTSRPSHAVRKSNRSNTIISSANSSRGGSSYKIKKTPQPPLREVYDVDQELMRYSDSDSDDNDANVDGTDDDPSDADVDEVIPNKVKPRDAVNLFVFSGSSDEDQIDEDSSTSEESDEKRSQQKPSTKSTQDSRLETKQIVAPKKLKAQVAEAPCDIETVDMNKKKLSDDTKSNGSTVSHEGEPREQIILKEEENELASLESDEDDDEGPVRRIFRRSSRESPEHSSDYSSDSDVQIIEVRPASSSEPTSRPKHRRLRMLRHSTFQTRRAKRRG